MGLTRIRAGQISDIDFKQAVKVVTTANVTLSGGAPSSVDSVSLSANDRILVAGQTNQSQNGIYVVQTLGTGSNGTWIRSGDANATGEIEAGMIVMVTDGTIYADTQWVLATNNPIVVGSTDLVFQQLTTSTGNIASGSSSVRVIANGNIEMNVAGTPNVFVVTQTGTVTSGTASVTGNVTAGNLAGGILSLTGNIFAASLSVSGNITASGNINYENVTDLVVGDPLIYIGANNTLDDNLDLGIVASANISGVYQHLGFVRDHTDDTWKLFGNVVAEPTTVVDWANAVYQPFLSGPITSTGLISTIGNIVAANVIGGANVNATLFTGTTVSVTGNITGNNVSVSSASLSGNITAASASLSGNITAASASLSGNITAASASLSGNITATSLSLSGNVLSNLATAGNVNGGNINSDGVVTAAGNVAGGNLTTTGALTVGSVIGNLIPSANITYDLGSNTARWKDLYLSNSSIYLGNVILASSANQLTINGSNAVVETLDGAISTAGNVTGGNINTGGLISAAGNITGGNLSTTGNVTAAYIIGNGSQLTGLPASYSNADVANFLAAFGSNTIVTTGNISGGNLNATGLSLSGNVVSALNVTGNITGGNVNTVGNITAAFFIGNGSQLTGLPASYSNTDVANFLSAFGSNTISTTGNITGGNLNATGLSLSGNVISALAVTGNITGGNVNTVGNATAAFFIGNGSQLTGLPVGYSNAAVANFLAAFGSNTISTTGNITSGNLNATGLSLSGNVLSPINTTSAITTTANITGGNILGGANVNATTHTGSTVSVTGNVTGGNLNATGLSLSGNVLSVINTTSAITTTGNITGGNILGGANVNATTHTGTTVSVSGNITGGNLNATGLSLSGNVLSPINTTSAITTTANITGGNLNATGLSLSGNVLSVINTTSNITTTGNIAGSFFIGNGSLLTGISSSGGINFTSQANTAPTSPNNGDFWYDTFADIKYQYINDGDSSQWVDQSFPTSFQSISVGGITNLNANGVGNIGSSAGFFNTVFAKATSAQYADLAEMYQADADYDFGTVVIFGGEKEITLSTHNHDTAVAGVISENPSFLMNSAQTGDHVLPVALTGRVQCLVQGPVRKGDILVTGNVPGSAQKIDHSRWQPGCVLGKSLEEIEDTGVRMIEIAVGRF